MSTRAAVERVPRDAWTRLVRSMERGDNIEESHYAERLWAAMLTRPLEQLDKRTMACATRNAELSGAIWFAGAFKSCRCADIASCKARQQRQNRLGSSRGVVGLRARAVSLPTALVEPVAPPLRRSERAPPA